MNRKSILIILFMFIVTAGLVACSSHKNPLATNPDRKESGDLLFNASVYAEKQMKIWQSPGGWVYGDCMEGKQKEKICHTLYKYMLEYAKKQIDYKTLVLSDLTDRRMWHMVGDIYKESQYDAI